MALILVTCDDGPPFWCSEELQARSLHSGLVKAGHKSTLIRGAEECLRFLLTSAPSPALLSTLDLEWDPQMRTAIEQELARRGEDR